MTPGSIITLTTDFGLSDPYVGQLKAVLLSLAPDIRIVDLTHAVAPQAVVEAAFLVETSWRYFPSGTVHVVIVDPGVGTARRRVAVAARGHYFLGPDNGCLSAALPSQARGVREAGAAYEPRIARPAGLAATFIEPARLDPRPISPTFEGRDVFAPAAARLALGEPLASLGPAAHEMLAFPAFAAPPIPSGLQGLVLRVDHFGNLITDIRSDDVRFGAAFRAAGHDVPLARTYAETAGLAAIPGSSGYIEIALPNGNAASAFGLGPGAPVEVRL